MKRIVALSVFAVAAVAAVVSCPAEEATYTDPAKTIEVELCKEFAIVLESNKTTGFGWDIAVPLDEKMVKFISCEYIPADTGLVGSGGKEIWTFRSVCQGKTQISFKYVRPWEKDVPPAKEMAFTVCAKDGPMKDDTREGGCSDQR